MYLAVDGRLKRTVALKILHPHLCKEPAAVERFRREALSAAQLDYPHIVRIYDYLEDKGIHGIAMEYVPGRDVETLVKQNGPFSFEAARTIMHKAALALKAAHSHGLMHRDVKPSNILLREDGRVMLSDFGLVKHSLDVSLTVDNAIAGTPAFMSPEQMSGKKVTFSSDVYSWAVTFHYLMVGALPYTAKEFGEIVRAIQGAEVRLDKRAVESLPARYLELISRCLLENPMDRPKDGEALVKCLSELPNEPDVDLVGFLGTETSTETGFTTERMSRTRFTHPRRSGALKKSLFPAGLGLVLVLFLLFHSRFSTMSSVPEQTSSNLQTVVAGGSETERALLADTLPLKVRPAKKIFQVRKEVLRQDSVEKESVSLPVLPPDSGTLFIACEPWANILIDGREAGQTPLSAPLTLSEGTHEIILTNPYSERLTDSIVIQAKNLLRKRYLLKVKSAYTQPSGNKP